MRTYYSYVTLRYLPSEKSIGLFIKRNIYLIMQFRSIDNYMNLNIPIEHRMTCKLFVEYPYPLIFVKIR